MDDLGTRDLALLGAVADHRSFRGASREFGLPASSVSHIVAQLERRLGIRLFLRSTRSVSLTAAGEAFLARVRPALSEIRRAVEDVHEFRDRPAGLVRVNASTWGAGRLLPIVIAFQSEYPDVRIDLVTEGRLVDIVADGFDAGLRLLSLVPRHMVAVSLGIPEALVIVGSPAYLAARGTPIQPGDLLAHECVRARLPSGSVMDWELSRGAEETVVSVTGRLIVGTTELSVHAAAAGAGLAFADAREAKPFLDDGRLVQVLADWTPPWDSEALYYPAQRLPSAAFRAFIDFVRRTSPRRTRGDRAAK